MGCQNFPDGWDVAEKPHSFWRGFRSFNQNPAAKESARSFAIVCPVRQDPAKKRPPRFSQSGLSAEGGTRTHMSLRSHGPEPCASTNFTTSAAGINLAHAGVKVKREVTRGA